ncbi:MAG: hypothetical protein ACRBN8_00490 [Nannocystales bacterium]
MMDQTLKLLGLGLCAAVAAGCPADDTDAADGTDSAAASTGETGGPTTDTPTSTTDTPTTTDTPSTGQPSTTDTPTTSDPDTTDTEGGACPGVPESGAAADEACSANDECESGVCLLFQDVPADDDAVCGAVMEDCSTRVTGTVYDFLTRESLRGEEVRVVKALDALTMPATAEPVASGTANDDGEVDFVSDGPISSPIAIIATVGGTADYFLTATGVAGDDGGYAPGTGLHEFFAVPNASLDAWNDSLDGVADDKLLPVGVAGGIVGFVRDANGDPVAGATVSPETDGSGAAIYYPQADDSVSEMMTDETGLFIAVGGAATGEDFVATADGLSGSGTAGTAANVVFSLVLTLQ